MKEHKTITAAKHSLFADFVNLFSGKVAHIALSLGMGIATARIWGAEGRGLIAVVMIWPTLICRFFEQGSMRSLPYLIGKGVLPIERAGRVLFMLWSGTALFSIGVTLIALLFVLDEDLAWPWLLAAGLLLPAQLSNGYTKGVALGVQEPRYITNVVLITGVISLSVILIAGWALGYNAISEGWVYVAARVLGFAAAGAAGLRLVLMYTPVGFTTDPKQLWSTLIATIRFGASGIIMQLNYYADVLLLSLPVFMIPKEDIGNYTIGIAAAGMLWLIPQALGMLMLSRGAVAEDPERYNRQVASTARGSIIAAAPVMIIIVLVCPYVFPVLYGPEFTKAGPVVQILSPSILAFFGARIFESGFNAQGRVKPLIIIMSTITLINILLNILWIPRYGIYGAAWASAITYPVGTIALGIAYARCCNITLKSVFVPRLEDLDPVTQRLKRLKRKAQNKQGS